ncbi:LysR family transcriptional regulator [Phreatobacter oligotrophus]|uniref:LysR family transcriptional regulator n=1 Tax=Phreatobacter oligotrophus TaxID=1122261 RepID=UPI002355CAA9|nr:LysR family transcriptional regulator [Phreatobacter oligotrophus]MBX9990954.1 LysR family transcriptional regulator [Phreatobacter oligotrophus]
MADNPKAGTPLPAESLALAIALADTGDLGGAGANLGIGKRTAAARIAQLEREIGVVLFDHRGKAVSLTRAGEVFIAEARLSLAAAARAARLARDVAERAETIGIGVTDDAMLGPLAELFADPAWIEAGFQPRLLHAPLDAQMAALAEGGVVLVFAAPPLPAHPRIQHRQVATSRWSAVVPDAEARLRKTASLSNLARKPLVTLERERAALAHDGVLAALQATGTLPHVAQVAENWAGVIAMVALGLGSALVPSIVAKRLAVAGATVLPLVEAEDLPPWTISCLWLPQPTGTAAAEAIALVKTRLG